MRRLVIIFSSILAVALLLSAINIYTEKVSDARFSGNVLNLYNWGDYIDPELITKFEDETGIKVVYSTFDSNEAAYNKMKQGGTNIDIAVPSDYMISKMVSENMLAPLDYDQIPNIEYIDTRFMHKSFDSENKYSLPYFWGTVGILYNTKMVENAPTSFNDLWDTEYKNNILLIDGAREIIGMALNSNGHSLNSRDLSELDEASKKLQLLTPNVKAVVGDEIKTMMANNEAAAAVIWSGEAAEAMGNNEDLDYVIPEEGTNLWFDNMVIPENAAHKKEAHAFINFMLDAENAAQNADYVGYATPVAPAMDILKENSEDGTLDERVYPPDSTLKNLEVYDDLGERTLILYNDLFLNFKIGL